MSRNAARSQQRAKVLVALFRATDDRKRLKSLIMANKVMGQR